MGGKEHQESNLDNRYYITYALIPEVTVKYLHDKYRLSYFDADEQFTYRMTDEGWKAVEFQHLETDAAERRLFWTKIMKVSNISLINNRKVGKALATEAFKAGSEGWDWSMGSIQDP